MRRILIAILLVAGCAFATPGIVQTKFGGGDGTVANPVTTSFTSSVSSGNWIVVFARNGAAGDTTPSISDTLGTSFTLAASNNAQNPSMWAWYGKAPSSGTDTVSVTFSATSYAWVFSLELSNLGTLPLDVAVANTNASGTDITSSAFSTAVAGEIVLLATSQNAFATYTAGANFTLINGAFPTNTNNFGGVEDYIPAGTLSSFIAHMTSTSSAQSTVVVVSFKPSAGGGSASQQSKQRKLQMMDP